MHYLNRAKYKMFVSGYSCSCPPFECLCRVDETSLVSSTTWEWDPVTEINHHQQPVDIFGPPESYNEPPTEHSPTTFLDLGSGTIEHRTNHQQNYWNTEYYDVPPQNQQLPMEASYPQHHHVYDQTHYDPLSDLEVFGRQDATPSYCDTSSQDSSSLNFGPDTTPFFQYHQEHQPMYYDLTN